MGTISTYSYTAEQLEDLADLIKICTVQRLVDCDMLSADEADKWCADHTVICRNKGFFRTISERWAKTKAESDNHYWMVVRR